MRSNRPLCCRSDGSLVSSHSERGARAAAHLLQDLQVRRAPADRPPGRIDRRHADRPRGPFPRECKAEVFYRPPKGEAPPLG